jgi:hypothetical protein
MANVSSSNTTTLYSTTQDVPITQGAAVPTGQVNESNFTTLYGQTGPALNPNGNQLINGNLLVTGTLQVDGCSITTDCTTFNLLPTTATTINFGLDATALNMGATTGTTTINNNLAVDGNLTINADDTTATSSITFKNGGSLPDGVLDFSTANVFNLNAPLYISAGGANPATPKTPLFLLSSTAAPTVGFGTNLDFYGTQPGGGGSIVSQGQITTRLTDATVGATDVALDIKLMDNSASPATKLTLSSTGDLSVTGNMSPGAGDYLQLTGASSGYSRFTAPSSGANIAYVLPNAQGAASTVLTNDGSGNLSWALPGGGGSQFGNITIGIVTDNTISTTTGDLDITSATNIVNINNDLNVQDDITLGGDIVRPIGLGDTLSLKYQPFTSPADGWNATYTENGTSTGGFTYYPLVAGIDFTTGSAVNNSGVGIKYATDLGSSSLTPIGSTEFIAVDIATNNYDFVVQKRDPLALPDQLQEIFRVQNDGSAITNRFYTYVNDTSTPIGIGARIAGNDYWNVGGYSISGTAGNDGALEIATANNGNEPIYVRQYTGGSTSGSAWPWGNTIARTLTLLDASGNTELPGDLAVNGGDITTTAATFNLLNANATTVNAFGAATSLTIGAATGTTQVQNTLQPAALRLSGSIGGSSTFVAPASGSTLSYVLPGAAGAANTVLTNDGSGNLSWALPGGGGSTFGNVTVGVVTDNTISTTTGDLDITSATGVINLDTYTALTDNRLTTTSVSTVTLDSLTIATYQSASYTITIKDAVTSAVQTTKIDMLHDGTTAYINQYANMTSASDLATFSATVSGSNAVLQITPASTNSTQFTYTRIAIKV